MLNEFSKKDWKTYEDGLNLEWLESNEAGSYASSSIFSCHTRKYHGLLVASMEQPSGKFVLLSNLEEEMVFSSQERYCFNTFAYRNTVHPKGYQFLEKFSQEDYPVWSFKKGEAQWEKSLMLLPERNTVIISYQLNSGPTAKLFVRPFLAFRDFHCLSSENCYLRKNLESCKGGFSWKPYTGMPTLFCQSQDQESFLSSWQWNKDFEYKEELNRGFLGHEDLFSPCVLFFELQKDQTVFISFSTEALNRDLDVLWNQEKKRRRQQKQRQKKPLVPSLLSAAKQFYDKSCEKPRIVAGFPWFLSWGRDSMIALPGLSLCQGDFDFAKKVLLTFSRQMQEGLIPNFIGAHSKDNAYNSVDASLWFAWAVQEYLSFSKDTQSVKYDFFEPLKEIFHYYDRGTRHCIHAQSNGLLFAGSHAHQLTWMDASVDGKPVTPRWGLAVEINALWYNFVCFLAYLARKWDKKFFKRIAPRVENIQSSFIERFYLKKQGYLCDCINHKGVDRSIRPNQIFALSLPYSPLSSSPAKARSILDIVRKHLLTPMGLRTLSPQDLSYRGKYQGEGAKRDRAYHNGSVWPWLLGHYAQAQLRFNKDKKEQKKQLSQILKHFESHLRVAGIGSISEICDGDFPHTPRGCISQAWSVGEILRLKHLLEKK